MGGAQKLKWIGCRGRTFTCLQTQLESSHYTGVRGPRWFQLACAADRKLGGNVEIWLCYFFKQFFFPRNRDARAEAATQTASVCVRGGGRRGELSGGIFLRVQILRRLRALGSLVRVCARERYGVVRYFSTTERQLSQYTHSDTHLTDTETLETVKDKIDKIYFKWHFSFCFMLTACFRLWFP